MPHLTRRGRYPCLLVGLSMIWAACTGSDPVGGSLPPPPPPPTTTFMKFTNGQAATVVIGQLDFVTSTQGSGANAYFVLGQTDFSDVTPKS